MGAPAATPPTAPLEGQSWIVGSAASGAWAGHDGSLALWSSGGWRFIAPVEGLSVWDSAARVRRTWSAGAWGDGAVSATKLEIGGQQVVGARLATIASPSGGTTIDSEARIALTAVIAALMSHGLIA